MSLRGSSHFAAPWLREWQALVRSPPVSARRPRDISDRLMTMGTQIWETICQKHTAEVPGAACSKRNQTAGRDSSALFRIFTDSY